MRVLLLGGAVIVALVGCGKQNEASTAATATAASTPATLTPPKGPSWEILRTKDEMTDEPLVSARLIGGEERDNTILIARCAGRRLEALATFDQFLGNDSRPVKYRFDQQPPQEGKWLVSAKGTAVFAPESADFVRRVMSSKRVLIEATDFRYVGHRAVYEWASGVDKLGEVLQACGLTVEGLEGITPGLRKEVALELERWGPKNIAAKKKALASVAGFKGEINGQMTPEFAAAAQSFHDEYIAKCRAGKVRGDTCDTIKTLAKISPEDINWSVGAVIYDSAPKAIRKEMGDLKIFE